MTSTISTRTARLKQYAVPFLIIVVLLAVGVVAVQSGLLGNVVAQLSSGGAVTQQSPAAATDTSAVTIRPATQGAGSVSASGNLELTGQRQVVVEVSGLVADVYVNVGDTVAAGDLMVALSSRQAEDSVQDALLSLTTAQLNYAALLETSDANEVAAAQANLTAAQARLADLVAGAGASEIAAAQSALAAANATYADLQAGPSAAELTQLAASLRKAEVTRAEAQGAYDRIAWRNDTGMTSEAATLQSATIDYESALAAYEEATAPASQAEIQNALSNLQNAQKTLSDLLAPPSTAEIASAEADVASAQANLDNLLAGADSTSLASAQVTLAQAQLSLDAAARDLRNTELRAPLDGTVLSVNLEVGQQVGDGTVALTLADVRQLQLTVNVAESDIEQVSVGMPAVITLDALPGRSFSGEVLRIAPSSDASQSVVNYPVTIRLTDADLNGVRAGMTAVATMQRADLADAWLVPAGAVQTVNGASQVMVIRNGAPVAVTVTTGALQGEWIIVESPQLQAGDQVAGSVASYVNDQQQQFGMPGGGGMAVPMGGQPPAGGGGGMSGGGRPGQ